MSENIEVHVRNVGAIPVVDVGGYVNALGGEKVAEICNGFIDSGGRRILLNLAETAIVNSVGISFLIEVIEKIKDLGGRLGFCCVSPTIAKTFQIMGLLQAATIYDGEADALQALDSA